MINSEFEYRCEDERKILEEKYIYQCIEKLLEEVKEEDRMVNHKDKGDIFGHKIAFVINKELIPHYQDNNYNIIKNASERITLEKIYIQQMEMKTINTPIRKYTFKERLKILIRGKV